MTTNKFSIGYVDSIDSVTAVETLFSNKGNTVESVSVVMSSKDHKNTSVILRRKEAKTLITKLQKLL